jgi:hypothetical protein
MPSNRQDDLDRVTTESQAKNLAAQASCEDTSKQIKASRKLIARSLELLGRRFTRLDG